MYMKGLLGFFVILCISSVSAQVDFKSAEDSLNVWQSKIGKSNSDEERLVTSDKVIQLFDSLLQDPESYEYPFESAVGMGILTSPDKAFKLYNWNIPMNDGTHRYECFVQIKPELENSIPLFFRLNPLKKEPTRLEARQFDQDDWLSCLYYDIIPVKKGKSAEYYLLLGWDGHNKMTKRKFVEPLTISKNSLKFGRAVFKMERGVQKRLVFEYSADVSMSLRYQEKQARLVFDHLSPRSAGLEGNFAFYGPDLTFDSFELKKLDWEFVPEIDLRQEKGSKDRPYNDPRRRK